MSTGKIRIDLNRNLCSTCKVQYKCEFDAPEYGDNDNVIRCKKYQKTNEKLKPHVEIGDMFYYFVLIDEKNPSFGYKPKSRVYTKNDATSNLLREVGNYFYTLYECEEHIKQLNKKKKL